jgi:putative transposase
LKNRHVLLLFLANKSEEIDTFVAERFLAGVVDDYRKHLVSTDGGKWYPMAHRFLKPEHHNQSFLAK